MLATGILDSCLGDKEVRMLLLEEAGARKFFKCVQWYKYPQLQVAVEQEHKEFVTHPYCQQLVMRDFQGNMNCKDTSFTYKCIYICMVVLLMPLHILGRNSIALLKSQQTFQQSFQYYKVSHTTIKILLKCLLKSLLRFQQSY